MPNYSNTAPLGQASATPNNEDNDQSNYWFILKCLGGLAAAAAITVGIIFAITAALAVTSMVASAFYFVPTIAILALIAAACIIPFTLASCDSAYSASPTIQVSSSIPYSSRPFFRPTVLPNPIVYAQSYYNSSPAFSNPPFGGGGLFNTHREHVVPVHGQASHQGHGGTHHGHR
jgi:hypothetical protein